MSAFARLALCALAACTTALGIEQPTAKDVDLHISMHPITNTTSAFFAFEIVVTNNGVDSVADGRVAVELPGPSQFGADSSPACQRGGPSASCPLPVLAAGESHRFVLTALPVAGTIIATTSAADDLTESNNRSMLVMEGGADVEVRPLLDGINSVVGAGRIQTYTFRVRNNGPSIAKTVKLDVTLSPGFERSSFGGVGWSCGISSCTLSELAVNAYSVQWIGRAPTTGGAISVFGTVSTASADFVPENNTTRYDQSVNTSAELSIALSATPDPVATGGTLTYTLDVRNGGPSAVPDATVTDLLPPGTTFVSASGMGWLCALAGTQVNCQRFLHLEVGSTPIAITVSAPTAAGSITNTATVTAPNPDSVPADNSASITTMVQ